MPFTDGEKLGGYEIVSPLGAGGMGEVYRARDSKLGREVAIKVLPEEFAEHPEKLARFEREARLLAALNHPKIATLYGVEEAQGQPLLIMELVEGETLAERIARGPIPVTEALEMAHQIAEALEAAHEKGVIHRDLKPANVKVDAEGNVKVLDFGLAKAFADDEAGESELSQSPTLSRDATRAGVILGTAAYMSPEQAKGKAVDKRTDIFSFGIVLYEMLTGKKAFAGDDVPEVLASIINREPDLSPVDPRAQTLLRRCLRKDRKKRLQAIGDARVEIEDILAGPNEAMVAAAREPGRARFSLGTLIAKALVFAALVAVATWSSRPELTRPLVRVVATPPSGAPLDLRFLDTELAITPDGTRIVYPVILDGQRQLMVRAMDELEATPLSGLEGTPRGPFISPDGGWVGYFDRGTLRKVSILGGPPITLCNLPSGTPRGASWGADGNILFATDDTSNLWRVPASGGDPEALTTPESGEEDHWWPEILPGGEAVLFTIMSGPVEDARLALLSLRTGEIRSLVSGGSNPRYASTGHIVYGVGGSLRAVGFDLDRLEVTSDPVPVLADVVTKETGAAEFDVADDGSLVYVAGAQTGQIRTLVWVDRDGREEAIPAEPGAYTNPRVSPDGTRIAIDSRDDEDDIWVWDSTHETMSRLTFDPGRDRQPVWTPDGRRVAFNSEREGHPPNLFWKAADGTGGVERLTRGDNSHVPHAISPDGTQVVFREMHPQTQRNLLVQSLDGTDAAKPLLVTEANEWNADISPDGRWMAYQSDASGQFEIYVRPFPNVDDGSWQVSRGGGTRTVWSRDGRELFYLNSGGQLTAVSIRTDDGFSFGSPEVVFEQTYFSANTGRTYDVHPDGKRFLMIKEGGPDDERPEVILVQNWFEELKRLVPPK